MAGERKKVRRARPPRPTVGGGSNLSESRASVSDLYPLLHAWMPTMIEALDDDDRKAAARLLGAATYFLPVLRGLEAFREHFASLSAQPSLDPDVASLFGQVAEHIYLGIRTCIFTAGPRSGDDARFLMEAQFLFYDFAAEPSRTAEWRDAEPHRRNQIFGFGKLRQRRERAQGIEPGHVLPDRDEYAVHSALVHPRPAREIGSGEVGPDHLRHHLLVGLGDLFEHARRTFGAAQEMLAALVVRGLPPDLMDQWEAIDKEIIEGAIRFLDELRPEAPVGPRPETVPVKAPLGGGQ